MKAANLDIARLDEEDRAVILSHKVGIHPIGAGPPRVPNDYAVAQVVPARSAQGWGGDQGPRGRKEWTVMNPSLKSRRSM